MIDFGLQITLWGYAITGESPRDPTVLRCEDRQGWVEEHWALWDRTAADLASIRVNGEPPPLRWALLPAMVAGVRA